MLLTGYPEAATLLLGEGSTYVSFEADLYPTIGIDDSRSSIGEGE
jgi:hypothetical protein